MSDIFYTFQYGSKRFDLECETREELTQWVDNWWAEQCQHESLRNGETRNDEYEIITLRYNEDGEAIDHKREKYALSYEHYHGDFAEHNTQWGL